MENKRIKETYMKKVRCKNCKDKICFSGKKLTVKEWNKCPWHLADWNTTTKWIFLPRILKEWWYFRNIN